MDLTKEEKREALMWAIKAQLDSDWVAENYEPIKRIATALLIARDEEWARSLGVTDKVLTPAECAKWLEADRVTRARNVAAARPRRGPMHY